MSHIFISYSHDDTRFASKLERDLYDQGYTTWIDNLNLAGGTRWDDDIMQAIDDCDVFLLVWTANIEGSEYSKKEKDRAKAKGKRIIPLLRSGDKSRLWADIQNLQWIDFSSDYDAGWNKLISDLPLPDEVNPQPDIKDLIGKGDMTFGGASRLWRSHFKLPLGGRVAIGLLLDRSEYGVQTFLVGYEDADLKESESIQVFMNFSGMVENDRFADYIDYLQKRKSHLWTVLVRGPMATTSRGLEYKMPYIKEVWSEALKLSWRGVAKVGQEKLALHLYMNAPVALGAGFCAAMHFRRDLYIYQVNLDAGSDAKERYFQAYQFDG